VEEREELREKVRKEESRDKRNVEGKNGTFFICLEDIKKHPSSSEFEYLREKR
jgi:hypothetical protein